MPFLTALIPLLAALASGSGASSAISAAVLPALSSALGVNVATAVGDITFAQWISIGISLAEQGPTIRADVQKMFAALHPAFAKFVADLQRDGPHIAAANIGAWLRANQPPMISGYGADGGVTEIPNPDAR